MLEDNKAVVTPRRVVPVGNYAEYCSPCKPAIIYMLGGKLVNGCQRVPNVPVPEDQRHRTGYGAYVRAKR
jgi:hypothetical protein